MYPTRWQLGYIMLYQSLFFMIGQALVVAPCRRVFGDEITGAIGSLILAVASYVYLHVYGDGGAWEIAMFFAAQGLFAMGTVDGFAVTNPALDAACSSENREMIEHLGVLASIIGRIIGPIIWTFTHSRYSYRHAYVRQLQANPSYSSVQQ